MRNDRERLNGKSVVDLIELIEGLWKQKWIVVLTATVVTLIGAAYALLATPIYEAKIFVQAPSQKDIAQLNYGRGGDSGLPVLTVKTIYQSYVRHLQSEAVRRQFYREVYLKTLPEADRPGAQDDLYAKFNKAVSVPAAVKNSPGRFEIVATSRDPQQAADWIVQYAQLAGEQAKKEIAADVRADALVKARNLKSVFAPPERKRGKLAKTVLLVSLRRWLLRSQSAWKNRPLFRGMVVRSYRRTWRAPWCT